jgi:hypothetical protein
MARIVALIFNWWNLFVRLADPDHHREALAAAPFSGASGPSSSAFNRRFTRARSASNSPILTNWRSNAPANVSTVRPLSDGKPSSLRIVLAKRFGDGIRNSCEDAELLLVDGGP